MMKHKYSICVLLGLLLICMLIVVFSTVDQKKIERQEANELQENQEAEDKTDATETESVTSSKVEDSYSYIILEEDGHLLVYYSDNMTVFFDSGISAGNLPESLLAELETGIRFSDEEELYEFLENYSS
jgi:cbb3-type cytochrome oxidase subunit 3